MYHYMSNVGTAIIHGDRKFSYQEFYERVDAVAGMANQFPETTVGLFMDGRIESMEIYLGLILAGKTVLPLPSYFPPQFTEMLKGSVGVEKIIGLGTGVIDPSEISYEKQLLSSKGNDFQISHDGGVVAMTSGTEGIPKIMKHGYHTISGGWEYEKKINFEHPEINQGYRSLLTAPMDSGVGIFSGLWYLASGATVVMDNRPMTYDVIIDNVQKNECDLISIYKTALRKIIDAGHSINTMPSLKSIIETGSPSQKFIDQRVVESFGPILYNLYASSELGSISMEKVGTDLGGKLRPHIKLDIQNKDELGIGEIWGSTDAMPLQIYGRTGIQKVDRNDYLTSGDYGYLNEDGLLVIAGRRSDKIITSGYKVYAGLVEKEINAIDGVYRSAVIGVEDDKLGQKVVAYIDGTANSDQIKRVLSDRLPFYMIPKEFNVVDKLPEGPTGKILKKDLVNS